MLREYIRNEENQKIKIIPTTTSQEDRKWDEQLMEALEEYLEEQKQV